MVELINERVDSATPEPAPAAALKPVVRSSRFKFYIHDGVDACRFELIGELGEADVPELYGCWRTAATTLGKRKLVLDLCRVNAVDDAGMQWIASMTAEGAAYIPGPVLHQGAPAYFDTPVYSTRRPGRLRRFLDAVKNLRLSSESPTQAQ